MSKISYASAVGSLMYVMVCTRLDIAHVVGVSRYMSNLVKQHWEAIKFIMRYLRGTSSLKLTFGTGKSMLAGYTDSNMARDLDHRKSTSGYVMTLQVVQCLGSQGCRSKLHFLQMKQSILQLYKSL